MRACCCKVDMCEMSTWHFRGAKANCELFARRSPLSLYMIASCFDGWRLYSVRCDEGVRRVCRRGPKLVRGFGAVIRRWPHAQTGRYSWFVGSWSFPESSPLFLSAFFFANFAQAESEQIRSAPSMNQTAGWMPSTGACPARSTIPMHIIAKPRITDPIFMSLLLSVSALVFAG